jgi:pimeloyl-ACP methyl ester carboxylesterase
MNQKLRTLTYVVVTCITIIALLEPPAISTAQAPRRTPASLHKLNSPNALSVQDLTGSLTPQVMANILVGQGVTISNVTFTGANISSGTFSGGADIIGFDSGVVLTSGAASDVIGPNQFDSITFDNQMPGDPGLTALAGYPTYDAAILEFDFVPVGDHVSFQFVFASDEYNEYVHSIFNDVFGFFINGVNCAQVEGSPVSVNTINNGNPFDYPPYEHPELYINNDLDDGGGSIDTEMDGLTKVLTCSSAVTPNQSNHLKLAIADASDYVLDSSVFIKAASITTERLPVILIPGMTASINWPCFLKEILCDTDLFWWWQVTAEAVYTPLIQRLNLEGYTESNHYLSIFQYDWRKPIEDNVERLKKRIIAVRNATGRPSVDLIGHSMGGLLARAYIQGSQYGNDVAHLVTLGSPHTGASKSYPFWEAAHFYEMDTEEMLAFSLLMAYYMKQDYNPIPVFVLRNHFPSTQDLLPTFNYLYRDDTNGLIPESSMIQRNHFLPALNTDISTLFSHTKVATFAGQGRTTTERFYVSNRPFWEWPNWDDGKPNWGREDQFKSTLGDNTVLVSSAILPSPATPGYFNDVGHTGLPGDKDVINATLDFLGISLASPPVDQVQQQALAFYLDGPAQATITDPLGRILSPSSKTNANLSDPVHTAQAPTDVIPGAQYIQVPGVSFQVLLIPSPVEGKFTIQVKGDSAGVYSLGVLDTNEAPTSTDDITQLWDVAKTQTESSVTATYALTYTNSTSTTTILFAETPEVQIPVWKGSSAVTGRASPGSSVEIHDASSNALLGTGVADATGHFSIQLVAPLAYRQRIYARTGGVNGVAVIVDAHMSFLPMTKR